MPVKFASIRLLLICCLLPYRKYELPSECRQQSGKNRKVMVMVSCRSRDQTNRQEMPDAHDLSYLSYHQTLLDADAAGAFWQPSGAAHQHLGHADLWDRRRTACPVR